MAKQNTHGSSGRLRSARRARAFTLIELLVVVGVIAVLAGILMSAVTAAQAKARRGVCLGNLGQMGRALQLYCGDYGGYLPSWAAWSRTYPKGMPYQEARCLLQDRWPECGEVEGVRSAAYGTWSKWWGSGAIYQPLQPPFCYRNIFVGAKAPGGDTPGAAPAGERNLNAVGLGYLLTGGYLSDASAFFCQNSADMPPVSLDWLYDPDSYGGECAWGENIAVADSLSELRKAGGLGARQLTHGDWDGLPGLSNGYYKFSRLRVVFSHYFYRCVPSAPNYWGMIRPTSTPWGQTVRLLGARPSQFVTIGEPAFKSQRQLGPRALVTDAWGKTGLAALKAAPGEGYWGHRAGYNALYGDGHTAWRGDAEQRIAFAPLYEDDGRPSRNFMGTLGAAALSDCVREDGAFLVTRGGVTIWHGFDMAGGVDVGVD